MSKLNNALPRAHYLACKLSLQQFNQYTCPVCASTQCCEGCAFGEIFTNSSSSNCYACALRLAATKKRSTMSTMFCANHAAQLTREAQNGRKIQLRLYPIQPIFRYKSISCLLQGGILVLFTESTTYKRFFSISCWGQHPATLSASVPFGWITWQFLCSHHSESYFSTPIAATLIMRKRRCE
jgi:hypothetical protein